MFPASLKSSGMVVGLISDGGGGMAGAAEQLTHFQQQLWTPPKLKVDRRETHAILRLTTPSNSVACFTRLHIRSIAFSTDTRS